MAKHPHKLILFNNKTWKCVLPDCSFFVHLGLAHLLYGKTAICWGCGETFMVDARSLTEDMPRCNECKMGEITEALERGQNQ